jgi:hypothetical protein
MPVTDITPVLDKIKSELDRKLVHHFKDPYVLVNKRTLTELVKRYTSYREFISYITTATWAGTYQEEACNLLGIDPKTVKDSSGT